MVCHEELKLGDISLVVVADIFDLAPLVFEDRLKKFFHIEKVYLLDSLIVLIEYLFAVFIANPILNMVWVKNQVYKAYLLRLYRPLEQTCRNAQKVANKLF